VGEAAPARGRPSARTLTLAAWALVVLAFLATRLAFLDRDLPPWDLSMYQPIDEPAYTLPAFNLHHYGTFTHQDVPWVPLEGWPMNVLQSLVTAGTLALDWSYWGFRMSSVLFGLVAFLALVAVVRVLVQRARDDGVRLPFPGAVVTGTAVLLLLADFSFLMGGRVVEATIARLAEVAVLLWLVARGTLLGPGHSRARSFALGLLAGLAVGFGYIYNAFLVPGVLLAVGAWAWGRPGRRQLAVHVGLAAAGSALAIAAYFGWVFLEYGQGPATWYETWVASYRTAGRAVGFDLSGPWDMLVGNLFRLDRPFMVLTLVALPPFAWWARQRRDPLGITVLALGFAFAAQATIQSDYPQRKMLLLLAFAVPIAAGGVLRMTPFLDWVAASRPRLAAWIAWITLVVLGTLLFAVPPAWTRWTRIVQALDLPGTAGWAWRSGGAGTLLLVGAVVGVAAVVVLVAAWRRPGLARVAGAVLVLAMIVPLVALDGRYVYTRVTTAYRDAMISVGSLPDAEVTAGSGSYAMQLYNDSRAVLEGYVYGMTQAEYDAAVERYFAEGRARWMFAYADGETPARWAGRGFRLDGTYPIKLPKDHVLGRYEYVGPIVPRS
jgi:hypothetical protein